MRLESEPAANMITGLTPLPSDPNTLSIRVDRKVVARIRAADLELVHVVVGTPWTDELAHSVQDLKSREQVRRRALRLLGHRAYSRAEMTERLGRHTDDAGLVQAVLVELESGQWIDDEAYARQFVAEISERKPGSAAMLVHQLKQRGIDESLAARVVSDFTQGDDEIDVAESLARRRLASITELPREKAARRIAGLLTRRGFDTEIVETVLERLDLFEPKPDP